MNRATHHFAAFGIMLLCFPSLSSTQTATLKPANENILEMVSEFLRSPDRDTRGIGLQQVREGLPGEAVTLSLADLLPKLGPPGQAALLDALGERGDRAARPAILNAVTNADEMVRAAALRALAPLGESSDVPLLAEKAASGSTLERDSASRTLVRLRGQKVNQAMLNFMTQAAPNARAELLRLLAERNATEAMPVVLQRTSDSNPAVRLAAIRAAKVLANAEDTAALVRMLASAREETERRAAEDTLLVVCARHGQACLDAVLASFSNAPAPARIPLLRALAVIGGPQALAAMTSALDQRTPSFRGEVLRILAAWPEATALPHLLNIARQTNDPPHQVLALRGVIRLAGPDDQRPADMNALAEAWRLATRTDERRLLLGTLGTMATPASLALAMQAMKLPELEEEAGLAVLMIAEKLPSLNITEARTAAQRILRTATEPGLRQRAEKFLQNTAGAGR